MPNFLNQPERRRETESKTITYEPVLEPEYREKSEGIARRREEWKDAIHRALFAITVGIVLYVAMVIFTEPPAEYAIIAVTVGIVFTFLPMFHDVNHRGRIASSKRALSDLQFAREWEQESLQLERAQHGRGLFAIDARSEHGQRHQRTEQRAMNASDDASMDREFYLASIMRGDSPAQRRWRGRLLPSGQRMTNAKWSEITADLESRGILARGINGTGYRLTSTAPAPEPNTVDTLPEDAICTLPR